LEKLAPPEEMNICYRESLPQTGRPEKPKML